MCNKDKLSKRLIYLDSVKRSSGSIEDLVFDIHPQIERIEGYEILDFDVLQNPTTTPIASEDYDINADCNLFTWDDTLGATINSVIPIQNYSPTQLANEITLIMNTDQTSLVGVYTATYDNQTDKYTIQVDGILPFDLTTTDLTNSVYTKLGFDITIDHIGLLTYTAENTASIGSGSGSGSATDMLFVYLKSRNITNILMDAPRNVGILANSIHRVKIDGASTSTKNKVEFPVFIKCGGQRLSEIDIKMVDCFGNDVDFNGIDWSLTIMVYYEDLQLNLINRII